MDELQATSELYELHYNPLLREVNELEQNLVDMLRIAQSMFSHLNVFDPIDLHRLQMKCNHFFVFCCLFFCFIVFAS